MGDKIKLCIIYGKRIIEIPFNSFSDLDMFTCYFNNKIEMVKYLNEHLNLGIIDYDKVDVYCKYLYNPRNKTPFMKKIDIMYADDLFDKEDLKKCLVRFYVDNPARILAYKDGIRNVNHECIKKFKFGEGNLTDKQIEMAVFSYFKNAGYTKYRNVYFLIKNSGYVVKKKAISYGYDRTNLINYRTDSEYGSYLKIYSQESDDNHDEVISELSLRDFEDVNDSFVNSSYGLFDGINKDDDLEDEINYVLIHGLSNQELVDKICEYRDKFGKNRGRRK